MAKQKPYKDGNVTKTLMVENIRQLLDEGVLVGQHSHLEQQCVALMSFYNNPPGEGYQYHWNHLWVMCSEFNQLYTKLQKLLWEDIDASKQPKTRLNRRIAAAELAISIWVKGHHFDEETGMVKIVPEPTPKAPPTPEQIALRKASINATWRNGNRNS
jgi:hypothetical protein